MDQVMYLYAAIVVLAAALSAIAIRSPRSLLMRSAAVALAGLLMATGYVSITDLLGRPKPASFEWAARNVPEATVLAAEMREGEAIYLWLQSEGVKEPRAYVLPWSMSAARQLHEAQGKAKAEGTKVKIRKPFERDLEENERMFYATPQPQLPQKRARAS